MLQNRQIKKELVVFAQWSRKGYALFASLSKVVKIARLSVDMCKSALLKSSATLQFIILVNTEEQESNDLDAFDWTDNLILSAETLPVVYASTDNYQDPVKNNYAIKEPIFCKPQSMGSFCF